jgi:hypothetical protein
MLVRVPQEGLERIIEGLKRKVYDYNSSLRGTGVYLKPYHIVKKGWKTYVYVGRYWYHLERVNGKLRWRYLGKSKPFPHLPDPPAIPELTIVIEGKECYVDDKALEQLEGQ